MGAFAKGGAVAFALVYFTFFLDNVLLTVLVPILPELLREDDQFEVNSTRTDRVDWGVSAASGAVLGAKAGAQVAAAGAAAAAVTSRGALPVLRAATALSVLASGVLCTVSMVGSANGAANAWSLAAGRAIQGVGAAGGGVAGLALVAAVAGPHKQRALAALLGATALGVLVGYPLGGAAYELWSCAAPFQIVTAAAAANLVMQCTLLDKEDFDQGTDYTEDYAGDSNTSRWQSAGDAGLWCAGAVLLTTSVMAALEPCLPIWIMQKFHSQRWTRGAVFVPDSLGYLAATAGGALSGRDGAPAPETVALAGQGALGLAAVALPHVTNMGWLSAPQFVLGAGLGALDAALVPALVAQARCVPAAAALVQQAAAAAYTLGPILGGLVSWSVGFDTLLRTLGVLNLLYAAALYSALKEHPLSVQWGAHVLDEDTEGEEMHLAPRGAGYTTLRD